MRNNYSLWISIALQSFINKKSIIEPLFCLEGFIIVSTNLIVILMMKVESSFQNTIHAAYIWSHLSAFPTLTKTRQFRADFIWTNCFRNEYFKEQFLDRIWSGFPKKSRLKSGIVHCEFLFCNLMEILTKHKSLIVIFIM